MAIALLSVFDLLLSQWGGLLHFKFSIVCKPLNSHDFFKFLTIEAKLVLKKINDPNNVLHS